MRIVGGENKGRALMAPRGEGTRPTSDRTRQAIFDMLAHAPWYGHDELEEAIVLDGYAGTGAMGLEALSRGAQRASFIERDRNALNALRANLDICRARDISRVLSCSVTHPPRATEPHTLIFLDPPYGKTLVESGLRALARGGWIAEGALIVAETGATEDFAPFVPPSEHFSPTLPAEPLVIRKFGAAKVTIWRHSSTVP
ncbi:16S rRNA (guanine(966)-N(2))-methyltransferase RsmD [Gluconobacter cerinus]|uniref:DNA methyltransferase n=1 Tax=Gluconobacter cerinus TaxID=38307 RepID=A0A1B6VJ50_9PROT|nr:MULTISPECIES: 16S rRNA (guanine(966)-N(2))-methyltransferase RsmD [Gluconobacter]MBS1018472.1 16S rRNA (guanine(966)-N(2))-methyltransferase RsmD [Gluconobacter cerinus]MBS1023817.1 16S rRNA (guanine(966)-N(2))-methyltransferase RsmD [Gluconobacter cerinus]MBS1030493.1 16S rRNA (guanine(966)-N(2))-methyltransferase RsmD [Gluconobacter cerinus]MBS1040799.1 16S rRNA (guanine(966)-N(2))-methyltransferase RsmD [Gluconobacter cerinus]MBS1044747.1 16S rRNA (guanine(966)-N(2))-methyltransferase Rs